MSARTIAQLAVLIALVVALGFALAGVPNVELVTLASFVAGARLGPACGAFVGACGMAIFSGFNPYGLAPPPVYAGQVVGLALAGLAGGLVGPWLAGSAPAGVRLLAGGALGTVLTLAYDLVTNLGSAAAIGALHDPWPIVAGGIAFGAWHVAWNAAAFAVAGPPLVRALRRRPEAVA